MCIKFFEEKSTGKSGRMYIWELKMQDELPGP